MTYLAGLRDHLLPLQTLGSSMLISGLFVQLYKELVPPEWSHLGLKSGSSGGGGRLEGHQIPQLHYF